MDHAPGPTIAKTAQRTTCTIGIHGSPECEKYREKAIQTLTMAPNAPATGVHKPTRRSIPAPAPMICRTTIVNGGASSRLAIPKWMSARRLTAARAEDLRRANHAQKSRIAVARHSRLQDKKFATQLERLKLGMCYPPFGGSPPTRARSGRRRHWIMENSRWPETSGRSWAQANRPNIGGRTLPKSPARRRVARIDDEVRPTQEFPQ